MSSSLSSAYVVLVIYGNIDYIKVIVTNWYYEYHYR